MQQPSIQPSIHPLSNTLIPMGVARGAGAYLQLSMGERRGFTLDRSPVYGRVNATTKFFLKRMLMENLKLGVPL
jgi:hypothetical protein